MRVALFLVLLLAAVACASATGAHWAVIVAGSKGYDNYRHQSDIYHAYQMLHANGIPDSNIIVFHYDDIADSLDNPHKGTVINYPGGPNEYPGVPKDYTKHLVTPENFMKVLTGQVPSGGTGKTLKSGPNDRVTIYFADHGAPGLVAFPGTFFHSQVLTVEQLIKTLNTMHEKQMYSQLVIYVEACESGSMFAGQTLPPNVYAVTAADPDESSYACDYDSKFHTYLNDCFSIDFLLNTEKEVSDSTYTLQEQFVAVRANTTESHVCQYGDTSMASLPISDFFSNAPFSHARRGARRQATRSTPVDARDAARRAPVPSWDVELKRHQFMLEDATTEEERLMIGARLAVIEQHRRRVDLTFGLLAVDLFGLEGAKALEQRRAGDDVCTTSTPVDTACMLSAMKMLDAVCPGDDSLMDNTYGFKYARFLHQACAAGFSAAHIAQTAAQRCQ